MATSWSVDEVARWIARLPLLEGASDIAQSFRAEEIGGRALLSYATRDRDDLKKDFSMSIGKATALLEEIRGLVGSSPTGTGVSEGVPPKTHGAVCRTPSSVRSLRLEADELTPMKLSRLKVRAREVGITDEQLDDADDADNVKQTVIEMILAEQSATVRSEALHNMKVSELKRLATQAGVSREQIDDADDEPDTRGVIIQLILETQTNEDPDGIEALRTELEEITKIKTLKARARQEGIDREQLDDADDADDVKDTIIKLILHKKQLGVSSASAQATPQQQPCIPGMLVFLLQVCLHCSCTVHLGMLQTSDMYSTVTVQYSTVQYGAHGLPVGV